VRQDIVPVVANKLVGDGFYRLTVRSHRLAADAKPGQFAELRIGDGVEPLLRRPLSIHALDDRDAVSFLYQVKGRGTAALSRLKTGDELDLIAPLGAGFAVEERYKRVILVGGGIGIAPLMFLAQAYRAKGGAVTALIGAQTKDCLLCRSDFHSLGCDVVVTTDDGSHGHRGYVTDILEEHLSAGAGPVAVYACGPPLMMRRTSTIAGLYDVRCQVSLEEKMACGIGVCLGCAVLTTGGYKRVCADGPVFEAGEIIWTG
jgi:dihydroorotate dehydrogenase electron transfer subunit